ncbi:hypothetical protein PVL29_017350 [Vitis rotundifolia]|uniref:DUF4283 domain-containing protein n=1 Tax=Vitis rotundifolia TaxID=103349 RepID=A0AA38ZA86_VITRO|nr:hypothetical protein PVL29_017350 [Vitis rotundifolia]
MKVERFEVEKKSFQVKFEGTNGGTWISITERSRGLAVSVGFGKEEMDWLTELLKKAVELEESRGFIRKIRGKTRTHLMEVCFNSRGRFMKITEIGTRRTPLILIVPEGDNGFGWEVLRKAVASVQESSDQDGRVSKETLEDAQASKGLYRGGRSYAEVVAENGPRKRAPMTVGKWAKAVICECKEKVQDWAYVGKAVARLMGMKGMVSITPISAFKGCFFVDSARSAKWLHEQGRLLVRERSYFMRRWSPRENTVVFGKFRRGWLELKGLPFHLWDEEQLKFILKKWGRVTKVAKETLKLVDLSKVKLWVEMLPNVILPALLEVEDGDWTFTVAVSVIGEDEERVLITPESTRCRDKLVKEGGGVSQTSKNAEGLRGSIRDNECYNRRLPLRSRHRASGSNLASEMENGRGRSILGLEARNTLGPIEPEGQSKAQPVRAQREKRRRGPPVDPGQRPVASSSSTLQREASSAKTAPMNACYPGPVEDRAGDEVIREGKGRAFVIEGQSLPNPSPLAFVGCNLKGPSQLGLRLGGSTPSVSRKEEDHAASKGKASVLQTRSFEQKKEKTVSKEIWTTLFPLGSDSRQGFRSRSEPLVLRKSSTEGGGCLLGEELGSGPQTVRQSSASPMVFGGRVLVGKDEAVPRITHEAEIKEGSSGRVGFDLRGSSVMDSPSSPETRGKGLIFEGSCELPGGENLEVSLSSPSQPPESPSFPSHGQAFLLSCPPGPDLPKSVSLSQSPMENRVKSEMFSKKDVVGSLYQKFVGIPVRDEEEIQCALSNQVSERVNPCKSITSLPKEGPNLVTGSQGVTEVSPSGEFQIDGLSPMEMTKVREVLCSLDIKVYSRKKNRSSTGI